VKGFDDPGKVYFMMTLDRRLFRSKLARRIFALFVASALGPVIILFLLSFFQVTSELEGAAEKQLKRATKAHGLAIYERLVFLENKMKMAALYFSHNVNVDGLKQAATDSENFFNGIQSITITGESGGSLLLFGQPIHIPASREAEMKALRLGKTVIATEMLANGPTRLFMKMAMNPRASKDHFLLAELNPAYVWGVGAQNNLPVLTHIRIVDQSGNTLIDSFPGSGFHDMSGAERDHLVFVENNKEFIRAYWTIFLKSRFYAPNWTIVLEKSKADIHGPLANFKIIFPLVMLLSIWVVLLISK
jgi:hypothetical protein